jgi:hypothetical protein
MKRLLGVAIVLGFCAALAADEGMWTFDNIPRDAIAKKYGVTLTDQWLDTVQKAVVRLETGCTGSFVSPGGLVLTNHHCVATCLADNSTAKRDLVADGFLADRRENELRCQGSEVSILVDTVNVTDQVTRAVAGVEAAQAASTRNQVLTKLEAECVEASKKTGTPLACEAVTLYQGGQAWLYKYKRYDDVRLAFAPEEGIAAFGGDPDNFQFPRWCLDMSLLRVYENGKPASPPAHLPFNWDGAKEGEPVFVAGHPGTTQRLLTVAQLKTQRDLFLPFWLLRFSELRGRLIQYSKISEEAERTAKDYLGSIENSHKVRRMQLAALLDDRMMDQRIEEEKTLRARVDADAPAAPGRTSPAPKRATGKSWSRTPGSKGARGSTASCSSMRARWCVPPTSAQSRTPSGFASTPTRHSRGCGRRSRPPPRSTPSSSACACRTPWNACANTSGRIT